MRVQLRDSEHVASNLALQTDITCAVLCGLTVEDNHQGPHIRSVDALIAEHSVGLGSYADNAIPVELRDALAQVQGRLSAMLEQLSLAHTTVAAQERTLEANKELILTQKKQILTVENRNEKLRHEDPIKRLLKQRRSNERL
jgi:hypothetical protein